MNVLHFQLGNSKPTFTVQSHRSAPRPQLVVNVNQSDYAIAIDAGVQVAVHKQSKPPLVNDEGIAVPTGMHAIGIKKQRIQDQTRRNCIYLEDLSNLNFLQGEYSTYSESACLMDCIHSSIADNCECIGARSFYNPDTLCYSQLPNCIYTCEGLLYF